MSDAAQPVEPYCDVLIVEDDLDQSRELADFIGRDKLVVKTAADGAAALPLARAFKPHVALLDYNLPDLTGVQLAEEMRQLLPGLAIIVMSGRIEGLSAATMDRLQIAAFMRKPVQTRTLRQTIRRLAATGRPPAALS